MAIKVIFKTNFLGTFHHLHFLRLLNKGDNIYIFPYCQDFSLLLYSLRPSTTDTPHLLVSKPGFAYPLLLPRALVSLLVLS